MKLDEPALLNIVAHPPLRIENGRAIFLSDNELAMHGVELRGGINSAKSLLKKLPRVYNFLQKLITPAFSPGGEPAIGEIMHLAARGTDSGVVAVNVGSGTKRIHPEVMNLDIAPFENVDIVARIEELPFKDGVLDLVVCDSVLEHIADSGKAIAELCRVVRPGGILYVTVPFMYPFHASPNDFYRWTEAGLRKEFEGCKVIYTRLRGGPMGALQGVLAHSVALVASFGIERFYHTLVNCCMLALSPLKLLDIIFMRLPRAHEVGAHLCLICRKK